MGKFDDLMSAVTFAESGEEGTAREMMKPRKTVLLAASDKAFDRSAFKYALNITKRVSASLEILFVGDSEQDRKGLREFVSEVEKVGFSFSLVVKKGCMKKIILDYTNRRNEIMFVIVGSALELDIGCSPGDKSFSAAWKGLKCPLVVVSKNEAPVGA